MNNLDFNNKYSYRDADGTSYGDLNGDGTTTSSMTEFTTGYGWKPIGKETTQVTNLRNNTNVANIKFPEFASLSDDILLRQDLPILDLAYEISLDYYFNGEFNGNNKTISNMYINRDVYSQYRNIGLFLTIISLHFSQKVYNKYRYGVIRE